MELYSRVALGSYEGRIRDAASASGSRKSLDQLSLIRSRHVLIVSSRKPSDAEPYLHSIDSGVGRGEPRVGDVHVPQFKTDIALCAEDVYTECRLVSEVHGVGSGRNVMVGE